MYWSKIAWLMSSKTRYWRKYGRKYKSDVKTRKKKYAATGWT